MQTLQVESLTRCDQCWKVGWCQAVKVGLTKLTTQWWCRACVGEPKGEA